MSKLFLSFRAPSNGTGFGAKLSTTKQSISEFFMLISINIKILINIKNLKKIVLVASHCIYYKKSEFSQFCIILHDSHERQSV